MANDREKLLQSAAKLAEKKKYDKAIAEYQRIIEDDPTDTRTMLKVGDLQSRTGDFAGAIATYNTVAELYARDGFFLKAIAVYKQIRELLKKHAPELAPHYSYVTPRLAEIYAKLDLVSDALAAYDEVATNLQKAGRDEEAVEIFKKTVELDSRNPLPHLRLAEANCKIQRIDNAVGSFWTAAQLLLELERPDDALKVIERILHFRTTPQFARAAAQLYIKKNDQQSGMQALAKLQLAFQADPKDLDTLALLAQAFEVIEQPDKALAVHIEMARLARDQNRTQLWTQIMAHLTSVAPENPEVMALQKAGPPRAEGPSEHPAAEHRAAPPAQEAGQQAPPAPAVPPAMVELDVEPEPESPAAPAYETATGGAQQEAPQPVDLDTDLEYIDDAEEGRVSAPPVHDDSVEIRDVANMDVVESAAPSAPEPFQASAHAHKAIVDAESFRRLGLLDKAVEALHIALEIDPNSVPIREKLREILVDAGERDSAIQETINIAIIHLHNQQPDLAEPLAQEVLELEPEHPDARTILYHVNAQREAQEQLRPEGGGHLESFDLEGVRPSSAFSEPLDAPLPSFPLEDEEGASADRPTPEAIEEVLEEAEFFAAQGLFSDAEAILLDTLKRAPDHILLRERLAEVQAGRAVAEGEHPSASDATAPSDHAFDIAASLDALDDFDEPQPQVEAPSDTIDVDQVFAKFKEGVKATVDESDASTHYDLGVAYKEMGLFADAISEFQLAAQEPSRTCTCYAMIGIIHRNQGELDLAAQAFETALRGEQKTVDQEKNLTYDLALLAQERGHQQEYAQHLVDLAKLDPGFRDVTERLEALGKSIPPPGEGGEDDDLEAAFHNLLG